MENIDLIHLLYYEFMDKKIGTLQEGESAKLITFVTDHWDTICVIQSNSTKVTRIELGTKFTV